MKSVFTSSRLLTVLRSRALPAALLLTLLPSSDMTLAGLENRQKADELLPVDCLLPGQVRKLGGQLTYLTARRPVKTTGVNCEIRGGEYVQYDRADYKTALAIWLPMAEQGDARAQNYVGEIYEKGLGTEPDYQLAAQWYGKAAAQEYAPAQVNLGQLHELGRGVDYSLDDAINLYRQASGIKGKQLQFVSWDYSEEKYRELSGKVSDQEAALAAQQRKIEALTGKLDSSLAREDKLSRQIADSRSRYRVELSALEDARAALLAQQDRIKELEAQQGRPVAAGNTEIAAQEQELRELQLSLGEQWQELNRHQQALDEQESQLAQKAADLAARGEEGAALDQALAVEKQSLSERSRQLAEREAELKMQEGLWQARREALARKEQAVAQQLDSSAGVSQTLAAQQAELDKLQAEVDRRERELASRESELHARNTELKQLTTELASLREQLNENASAFSGRVVAHANPEDMYSKPVIEMIEPQLLATRSGEFVVKTRAGLDQRTIIGRVMGQNPIIELLVNERMVRVDERGLFQERIPIRGKETRVSIVAVDKVGLRSDLAFLLGVEDAKEQNLYAGGDDIETPETAKRKVPRIKFGNYHALLIGNKDYQSLPDLDTTIYDATALRDVLRDQYGFKTTLLQDATRYDILSAMEKLREELTEDDNLLIYYAGHGELDEVNTRGHWLPVDAEENSRANWISNVAISDILNSMSANKVLVVADSCYSGSMTRSTLARLDAGRSNQAWVSWLKKQANSHSRLLFSSGGVAPVLDGGGGKHSIFAKALLDVLRNNEGVLEGRQVHAQVAQAVNYAALAAQFDQTPQYAPIKFAGHEGGDFLFVAQN
ncbi:MAG: caspase family protein [Halioglobus sp.]|nr:caspase family protein [Halioglobus sp.]